MSKIMIDIGHGGVDPGASGNGLIEKDINLKVGLMLRDYLSKFDVEVRTTRNADITLSNDTRVGLVNSFSPDLCVSVHHNAASNATARGAEVIHAHYDQEDDKLAARILDNMAAIGMPKRRIFTRLNDKGNDWYFMIRRIWNSKTHAVIFEGGFVTNAADTELLKKDEFLEQEAAAVGSAIVEFMQLQMKQTAPAAQEQWWDEAMARIKAAGLVKEEHNGNEAITWGEMAEVLSRLLDKLNL